MTAAAKDASARIETRDRPQAQHLFSGGMFGDPARGMGIWLASGQRYAQWLQEIASLQLEVAGAMAQNLMSGTTAMLSARSYEDCLRCKTQLASGVMGTATSATQKVVEAACRCQEDITAGCLQEASSRTPSSRARRSPETAEPIEVKTAAQ